MADRQPFELLEEELAAWAGYRPEQVVACASGSSALILAFEALRLPPGAEVVCPDFAMIACARGVSTAGLVPVFVDCGPDLNLDTALLPVDAAAVLAVHTYGRRCDMHLVRHWKGTTGGRVVEDMSEIHGVRPHSESDAAAYSFYRNKVIHAHDAEGGAVLFRDPAHAALARQLRSLGFTEAHDFRHVPRGGNHRLSNAHAGLIRSCLLHADRLLAARREIEEWYDEFCPADWKWRQPPRDVVWVYDVKVPGLIRPRQAEVVRALNEAGVAARMGFYPLSRQEEYRRNRLIHGGVHRAGEAACGVFYLPVVPGSTTRQTCQHAFRVLRDLLPAP